MAKLPEKKRIHALEMGAFFFHDSMLVFGGLQCNMSPPKDGRDRACVRMEAGGGFFSIYRRNVFIND